MMMARWQGICKTALSSIKENPARQKLWRGFCALICGCGADASLARLANMKLAGEAVDLLKRFSNTNSTSTQTVNARCVVQYP